MWTKYPQDKTACLFINHAQVITVIYNCGDGNELVRQYKRSIFGIQHVCGLYYGKNSIGEEMDLTSLAPKTLSDARVVVVEELRTCVDFDDKGRKLKYGLSDMLKHNTKENMLFNSLHLICGNHRAVNYFDLPKVKWERYDRFMEV